MKVAAQIKIYEVRGKEVVGIGGPELTLHSHWVHSDTEGRSRIVGEMTHFIDLMQCLLNEKPISVFAERVSGDNQSIINNDNVISTIKFDRGSVATLIYASMGNRSLNREYFELFFDGKTIISTDFRKTELIANKSEQFKTSGQSIGHTEEINYFIDAVSGKNNIANLLEQSFILMQTAFAIEESLSNKKIVTI